MKNYKIIYNSKKAKGNKFSVHAEDKNKAKENFKKEYIFMGGNWENVLKIVSIEEFKEDESINDFFKS